MDKDILYIIDLDRTLIDVEKVMEVVKIVCDEMEIDFEKIYKDQQDLSKRGIAYSPFSYRSARPGVDVDRFKTRFIKHSKKGRILFPDSQEFIDNLKSKVIDFVILTHGVDDEWQILKIKAANLAGAPYVIVKDRYKGRFISDWVNQENLFSPNMDNLGVYAECIFVDDRKEAFIDIPDNCHGYLLDRAGKIDNFDPPGDIQIIKSLSEIDKQ